MNLTPKQLRALQFVRKFRDTHGYSPTLQEIASSFGVSRVSALQLLRALERQGAIRRRRYRARSIEILEGPEQRRGLRRIQIAGTIAAGSPIEAVEVPDVFDLADFVKRGAETFILRVRGDSMIEDQIRDGDYVICERRSFARNGETVVAVLKDGEATLKKFFRERDGRIRLQPANPTMRPTYPDKFEIRGVVIGLLRKY